MRGYARPMRARGPTTTANIAAQADLLGHHDTQSDLLRLPDAESIQAFIAAATDSDVWIVGFEGFEVLQDGVRPDMEAIVDLASCSNAAESRHEARVALSELLGRRLAYEFDLRS